MLESGNAIDGYRRHVTLLLVPQMREWPTTLEIRLHSNGDAPARTYAPLPAHDAAREPVHVKQLPDGRYVAAAQADAPPGSWEDCGMDVFDVVLTAIRLNHPGRHTRFIAALRQGLTGVETDAQSLRSRLAEHVRDADPECMRALATTTPLPYRDLKGFREVDAWMLQDIAGLGEARVQQIRSLSALARHYRAMPTRVQALVSPRTFQPTDYGLQLIRQQEDAHFELGHIKPGMIHKVVEMGPNEIRKCGFLNVAHALPASIHSLRRYVHPRRGLTDDGHRYLLRKESVACHPPGDLLAHAMATAGIRVGPPSDAENPMPTPVPAHSSVPASPVAIEAPGFQAMVCNISHDDVFGWASPSHSQPPPATPVTWLEELEPVDVARKRLRLEPSSSLPQPEAHNAQPEAAPQSGLSKVSMRRVVFHKGGNHPLVAQLRRELVTSRDPAALQEVDAFARNHNTLARRQTNDEERYLAAFEGWDRTIGLLCYRRLGRRLLIDSLVASRAPGLVRLLLDDLRNKNPGAPDVVCSGHASAYTRGLVASELGPAA